MRLYILTLDRDGGWSNWGEWSNCSHTCGNDGMKSRNRTCNNPTVEGDGVACVGDSEEDELCNQILVC